MSEDASDERQAIAPIDQLTSGPIPLTFSNTKGKGVPFPFMPLDKALDRLGTDRYPNAWGRLPAWHLMPFRNRPGQEGYYRPVITVRKKSRKLDYVRIDATHSIDQLCQCAKLHRRVYRRFLRGVECHKFNAEVMWTTSGEQEPVPLAFWRSKTTMIFYTGCILSEQDGYGRIIVHRKSFEVWVSNFGRRRQDGTDRKALSEVKKALQRWTEITGFTINRFNCFSVVHAALASTGMMRLENDVAEHVWDHLPGRKGGKPKTGAADAFTRGRSQLQADIEVALTRLPAGHRDVACGPKTSEVPQ